MKKLILILLTVFTLSSCEYQASTKSVSGLDNILPDEIKGMKVYNVHTDDGYRFLVATLPDKSVNSITYPIGKSLTTTIIVNPNTNNQRTIIAREIISENDSIIVLKK